MTGIEEYNFPAFDEAEKSLSEQGWEVISPAQMDREAGFNPAKDEFTPEIKEQTIRRDVEAVLRADAIALLPGFLYSTGATAELALARWRGIRIFLYHKPNLTEAR